MSEFETAKIAVVELLQKNGALDSIKAQLRSSVFLALQASAVNQGKNKPERSSQDSELAFLVKDFLQTLGLTNTAAVLEAEWGRDIQSTEDTRAIKKLDSKDTLIGSVFKGYKNHPVSAAKSDILTQGPVVSKLALTPINKENASGNPVKKSLPPTSPLSSSKVPEPDFLASTEPSKPKSREEEERRKVASAVAAESAQKPPAASQVASAELPSKTENMLALQLDSDESKATKNTQIDIPASVKPIPQELEPKVDISEKAPRQRYRSSNQTDDFYNSTSNQPNLKSDKPQAAAELDEESEQHSSERSATKAAETDLDYFEPVIKDI